MMDYEMMDRDDEKVAPYDSVISEDSLSSNRESFRSGELAGPSRQSRKIEELFPWLNAIDNEFRYILKISWCRRRLLVFMTKYIQVIRDNLPTFIHFPNRCFVMARYMSKCMFLFKELFNSFADSNEYLVRICEMLITYTLLELKHAVKFSTTKTLIADRIAMNYDIHLKSANISYLLRVFMELPTFFQQKEVMSKIFEKYLKKPETFVKKELPDKLFVMYIVAYKLWRSVESDEFVKEKIDNIAHRYMYPKSTLQKNRRYAPFLPNYETVDDAAITILKKSFSLVGLVAAIKAEDMDINPENVIDLSEETRTLSITVDDDEESETVDSNVNIKLESADTNPVNPVNDIREVGESRQKFEVEWIEFFVKDAIEAEPMTVRIPSTEAPVVLDTIVLDESEDEDVQEKIPETTKDVQNSEKEIPVPPEAEVVIEEQTTAHCESDFEPTSIPMEDENIDIVSTNEIINEVIVETTEEICETTKEFEDIITEDLNESITNTSANGIDQSNCVTNSENDLIYNMKQNNNKCQSVSENVENVCEESKDNETELQNESEKSNANYPTCKEIPVNHEETFFDHTSLDHNYEVITSVISSVVSDDSGDSFDQNNKQSENLLEQDEFENLQAVDNDIEVITSEVETILVDDNDDDDENSKKSVNPDEIVETLNEDIKPIPKYIAKPITSVRRKSISNFRNESLSKKEVDSVSLLAHNTDGRYNEDDDDDSFSILNDETDSTITVKKSPDENRKGIDKSNPPLNILFSGKIVPLNVNPTVAEPKSPNSNNVVFSMCRKTTKRKLSSFSDIPTCHSIFNSISDEPYEHRYGLNNIESRSTKSPSCRETIRKSNSIRSPSTYKNQESRLSRIHNDVKDINCINSNETNKYNLIDAESSTKDLNRSRRVSYNELSEKSTGHNNLCTTNNSEDTTTINYQQQNHHAHHHQTQQTTLSNNQHKQIPGYRCGNDINNCSIRVIDSGKAFYRNDEKQQSSSFCEADFSGSNFKREDASPMENQKKRYHRNKSIPKTMRKTRSNTAKSDFDKYLAKLKEKQKREQSTSECNNNTSRQLRRTRNNSKVKQTIFEDVKLRMTPKVVLEKLCPNSSLINTNNVEKSHKVPPKTPTIPEEFKIKVLKIRLNRCKTKEFKGNKKQKNKLLPSDNVVSESILESTGNVTSATDCNECVDYVTQTTPVSSECSSKFCRSKLVQAFLDVPLIKNMLLQITQSENSNISSSNGEAFNRKSISSERENEVSSTQETYLLSDPVIPLENPLEQNDQTNTCELNTVNCSNSENTTETERDINTKKRKIDSLLPSSSNCINDEPSNTPSTTTIDVQNHIQQVDDKISDSSDYNVDKT